MPEPAWRHEGTEPDYRFTLAQGRPLPFSWILPALAGACLLTSAVLVVLLVVA